MSDLTEWKLINTFWKRRDFNDYVSQAEVNWEPKMLKTLKLIHLILRRYSRFSPKIFQFWKFRLVCQNYVIKKWSLNFFCIFWHPQIQLKIFFIIFSQNQSNKHFYCFPFWFIFFHVYYYPKTIKGTTLVEIYIDEEIGCRAYSYYDNNSASCPILRFLNKGQRVFVKNGGQIWRGNPYANSEVYTGFMGVLLQ